MAFGLYPAITEGSAAYKLHYIYTHYHYSATRSTCNFEDKDTPSGRQRALIIIHLQDIFRKIISRCPLERLPAAGAPPRRGPRELPAMCSLCSIRIRFRSSKKPSTWSITTGTSLSCWESSDADFSSLCNQGRLHRQGGLTRHAGQSWQGPQWRVPGGHDERGTRSNQLHHVSHPLWRKTSGCRYLYTPTLGSQWYPTSCTHFREQILKRPSGMPSAALTRRMLDSFMRWYFWTHSCIMRSFYRQHKQIIQSSPWLGSFSGWVETASHLNGR